MQEIVSNVQNAFAMAGGSVGLSALFMAGLIVLWYSKFEGEINVSSLFWYALIMLLIVINPVYLLLVVKHVPELKRNNLYLWLLPITPVILYAGVTAVSKIRQGVKRIAFIIGVVGVLILAVTTSFSNFYIGFTNNAYYIDDVELDIFEHIDDYMKSRDLDGVLLVGPDEIMEDSRKYSGAFFTLYGKELWRGSFDSQLIHSYESWQYTLYRNMYHPTNHVEEIALIASANGCDVVVLSRKAFLSEEVEIPEALADKYYLNYYNDSYLLYIKAAYKEEE